MTTDVRPVRPPMLMPAMLSMYAVPGDVPASPAPSVATASTMRPSRRLRGLPSSSTSPAACETPMKVEIESNRSVKRIARWRGERELERAEDVELRRNAGEVRAR